MLFTVVEYLVNQIWGMPLIVLILGAGIFFTVKSGFFQFLHFGYVMKNTVGRIFSKKTVKGRGTITPFQAVSVAIGSTVGVGNIGGVATAVAVGGPGAVFWMWMAGIFGQLIKMVEVSLAVHYRSNGAKGTTFGGPTYYIRKGIGVEKRKPSLAKFLNVIFLMGFFTGYIFTMQNFTVSEAIAGTYKVNILLVSVVFLVLLYISIWGGLKKLGEISARVVPFMCLFFIGAALFIVLRDISSVPRTFGLIFQGAFTGSAAVGGFTGAAFAQVIQVGMARAVYSNEAGWGSSPMIHASAKVDHPIKQGLLGVFEVFVDTMVICTLTAILIINTGQWSSGLDGATLTLSAFHTGIGSVGSLILVVGIFLFGLTTSSGLYAQFEVLLRYIVGEKSKHLSAVLKANRIIYPLPGFLLVLYAHVNGLPTYKVWMFADLSVGLPIFINLFAILMLTPKFMELFRDYKARYMGMGETVPGFKVFYEDPEVNPLEEKGKSDSDVIEGKPREEKQTI